MTKKLSEFGTDGLGNFSLTTATAKMVLPQRSDAATPTFAFGDGQDGVYSASDGQLNFTVNGLQKVKIDARGILCDGNAEPLMRHTNPSITNPGFCPNQANEDTGLGGASDELAMIIAGVNQMNYDGTYAALSALLARKVTAGITASTTQTQGQGALTSDVNEVATVANSSDTVTLPTAAAGMAVVIINNGANTLQVFPAASDNLGAGVDTATTLAAGANVQYVAYDATNWETV